MSPSRPIDNRCPRCQALLAVEARGNCPACLFRAIVSTESLHLPFPAPKGYTLISELGRGGSGVVWKAHQQGLQREVALKVLAAGVLAGDMERSRLRREAEAMARLNHPHIVSIYEVGEVDGYVFIAMEFLGGGNLAQFLRSGPMQPRAAARLLADVTDAVSHAHGCGVIHRDLKPANILLDAVGAPHLADFGLAKLLPRPVEESRQPHTPFELTLTGHPMGTVHYLAPEQAGGSPRHVTPAADIHALGAILYHCLTGRPPYLGTSFAQTLRQAIEVDPPSVRSLNPLVPRDLEYICHKCLRKSPSQRYSSAAALFQDLNCFLNNRPVVARPLPLVVRFWGMMKRFPGTTVLLGTVIGFLLLGMFVSNRHATIERRLRLESEKIVRKLEFTVLDQLEAKGERDLILKNLTRLARENPHDSIIAERMLWALQEAPLALPEGPPLRVLGAVGVAVSNNKRWLAMAMDGGRLNVMDTHNKGEIVWSRDHAGLVNRLVISNDGETVVGSNGARISLWSRASTNRIDRSTEGGRAAVNLSLSHESRILATVDDQGNIELWDLPSFRARHLGWRQPSAVRWILFSPDSKFLSTSSPEEPLRVWNVADGKLHFSTHGTVAQHDWSSDSRSLLTSDHGTGWIEVWEMGSRSVRLKLGPVAAPTCTVFSPDQKLIASATYGGVVQLWNAATGRAVGTPMEHQQWVERLTFSQDGTLLATLCHDGVARIWAIETCRQYCQPMVHPAPLRLCEFTGGRRSLVTLTGGGWVQRWNLTRTGTLGMHLVAEGIPWPIDTVSVPVAASLDGSSVLAASGNGRVQFASAVSGAESVRVLKHDEAVHQVAISADSQRLATVTTNGIVRVWDAPAGGLRFATPVSESLHTTLKFSPHSRKLVLGTDDGGIEVVDADTGEVRRIAHAHKSRVMTIAFHPSKEVFATGGQDYQILLWHEDSLTAVGKPLQNRETPSNLCFSPGGDVLYATCQDNTIVRWDVASGVEIRPVLPLNGPAYSIEISSSGSMLLNACNDGNARLWDLRTGSLLKTFPLSGQMRAALSLDERYVVTANDAGVFRVWDRASGLAVSGFVQQRKGWIEPRFAQDGQSLLTGSRAIEVCQWPIPPVSVPLPQWLLEFADALSGRDLNPDGSMVQAPPEKRWIGMQGLMESQDSSPLAKWARGLIRADDDVGSTWRAPTSDDSRAHRVRNRW